MGKLKKNNTIGFPYGHVPHNKGKKSEKVKTVPAPYIRLSAEMHRMVQDTASAAESAEMALRPTCYRLLRPRKGKDDVPPAPLNKTESEQ